MFFREVSIICESLTDPLDFPEKCIFFGTFQAEIPERPTHHGQREDSLAARRVEVVRLSVHRRPPDRGNNAHCYVTFSRALFLSKLRGFCRNASNERDTFRIEIAA